MPVRHLFPGWARSLMVGGQHGLHFIIQRRLRPVALIGQPWLVDPSLNIHFFESFREFPLEKFQEVFGGQRLEPVRAGVLLNESVEAFPANSVLTFFQQETAFVIRDDGCGGIRVAAFRMALSGRSEGNPCRCVP